MRNNFLILYIGVFMGIYLGDQPLAVNTIIDIAQDLEVGNVSTDKVTSSQCVKNAIDEVKNAIENGGSGTTPVGGTTGQVLSKTSDTNHDVTWKNTVLPANEEAKLRVWTGNSAEYNAITIKDSNTLYNVTGDFSSAGGIPSHCGLSYSVEETLTGGTWVDGRPIYQITIMTTAKGYNMQMIPTSIPNNMYVLSVGGLADCTGKTIAHQFIPVSTSYSHISVDTREGNYMTIRLDTPTTWNGMEMFITVQYIKPPNI